MTQDFKETDRAGASLDAPGPCQHSIECSSPKFKWVKQKNPNVRQATLHHSPLQAISSVRSPQSCQRTAKGASGKGPRQKSSKSVKNVFDTCRQFSRRAKKLQKSSKSVENVFDTFRAAPVFRPLLGGSDLGPPQRTLFGGGNATLRGWGGSEGCLQGLVHRKERNSLTTHTPLMKG